MSAVENDYERQRRLNIEKNKQLLKELELTNIGPRSTSMKRSATQKPASQKKKVKREFTASAAPRRTSARIAGLAAESDIAHQKAEEEFTAVREVEKLKRIPRRGNLNLEDLVQENGDWDKMNLTLQDLARIPFNREEFKNEKVSKELRAWRQDMENMKIFDKWEPNDIRITPERIYFIGMHPSASKPLVFAGDKVGNLGIWDVNGYISIDDDDGEVYEQPHITSYKIHSRTVSQFLFSPTDATKLLTSSYDTSLRILDLSTGVSSELYFPSQENDTDALISSCQMQRNGNVVMFANFHGDVGRLDLREPRGKHSLWSCHEKKIGGLSIFPGGLDEIIATTSLDRTMKIWDCRKITKHAPVLLGQYLSTRSISSADFNQSGDLVATSYDDTCTVFRNCASADLAEGHDLGTLEPDERIGHNNQTGRFVSVFKARWHTRPEQGGEKFCIGNMRRGIDVYSAKGELLNHFYAYDKITAVPAVVQFHESKDWLVGGTASGKVVAYGLPEWGRS